MTRTHNRRTATLAVLAASALAMAACGSSESAVESAVESTVESAVDEPGALNDQGQIDLDALTEVPAEDFLDHDAYLFTFPGTGSNGCTVPIDPTDMDALIPFGCDAIHVGTRARMTLEYGTVFGFSGNESRKIELTSDTKELKPGEKVNASGFILARPTEDTVLVKRGANAVVSIDLEKQEITGPDGGKVRFDVDPFRKHCLLNGLDDIGLTLEHAGSIDTYETSQRGTQPWLWA